MADEKLSWALQFDLAGSGLRDAKQQMAALQQELGKGQKALFDFEVQGKKVQVELEGVGSKASKLTSILGATGAAIGMVVGGLVAGVSALDAFGDRAIAAFGERQGTIRAYTTLLGDAKQAQVEFGKAQSLAAKTDLTSGQTEGAQKSLMVAGFRGKKLDQALLATLDVASMAAPAERQMTMDRVSRAMGQIFSKGKLQGEELMQLSEAGLSRGKILEELRAMGVKGDVEKALSGGKVSADMGIAAIERAVLKQFGTSRLGEFATGSAGSATSLISNRDEAVQNLLKSFDADEMLPGMERYKASLREQGEALSLTTTTGRNATTVLQDFANTSLSLKSAWTEFTTGFIEAFTSSYTKMMTALGVDQKGLNDVGNAAKRLGTILGENVGPAMAALIRSLDYIAPVVQAIATGIQAIGIFLSHMAQIIVAIGTHDYELLRSEISDMRADFDKGKPLNEADQKQADAAKAEQERIKNGLATTDPNGWLVNMLGEKGGAQGGGNAVSAGLMQLSAGLMQLDAPGATKAPGKNKQALKAIGAGGGAGGGGHSGGGGGGGGGDDSHDVYNSVTINITGGKDSAEKIADVAAAKVMRAIGRYGRTPAPGTA